MAPGRGTSGRASASPPTGPRACNKAEGCALPAQANACHLCCVARLQSRPYCCSRPPPLLGQHRLQPEAGAINATIEDELIGSRLASLRNGTRDAAGYAAATLRGTLAGREAGRQPRAVCRPGTFRANVTSTGAAAERLKRTSEPRPRTTREGAKRKLATRTGGSTIFGIAGAEVGAGSAGRPGNAKPTSGTITDSLAALHSLVAGS